MIILVILLYSIVFYLQLAPMIKAKQIKELWINVTLGGIAFLITATLSLGIKIPSPPLDKLISGLFGR